MTDKPNPGDRNAAARAMRALSDTDREEAIAAASNVFGFERFVEKNKQVALSRAYRRPKTGGGKPA